MTSPVRPPVRPVIREPFSFPILFPVRFLKPWFEGEANDPNQEASQGGNCFLTIFSLFFIFYLKTIGFDFGFHSFAQGIGKSNFVIIIIFV